MELRGVLLLHNSTSISAETRNPQLNELILNEREKLRVNQETRDEIWSKLLPFLLFALVFYSILSSMWLLYNYYTYKRQKMIFRKSLIASQMRENRRLLKLYEEIPSGPESIDTPSSSAKSSFSSEGSTSITLAQE